MGGSPVASGCGGKTLGFESSDFRHSLYALVVKQVDTTSSNLVGPRGRAGSNPAESTKYCSKCGLTKPIAAFSSKGGRKQASCKACHAAYAKGHYAENKDRYVLSAKSSRPQLRDRNRAWIHEHKSGRPCSDCQQMFPAICMDFDHLDGATKVASIARLVMNFSSIEKLEEEIRKCELVCANCHRIRTYRRLHGRDPT